MPNNMTISFSSSLETTSQLEALVEQIPNTSKSRLCDASLKAIVTIPAAVLSRMRREDSLDAGLAKLVQAGCKALGYV